MGQSSSAPTITPQDRAMFQMKQQRDKIKQYQKRINITMNRQTILAQQALANGDRDRAKFYLRSKKHQQSTISKTYEQLDNLEMLIGTIEFKLIEKDVIYGLSQGNKVLESLNGEMSVDKIDKVMDDLEEERIKVDEVSGALSGLSNRDEDEVDEELERLEMEKQKEKQEEHETNIKMPLAPKTKVDDNKIDDKVDAESDTNTKNPNDIEEPQPIPA